MRPSCAVCGGRYTHLYLLPDRSQDDPSAYVCRRCYRLATGEPPRGMAATPPAAVPPAIDRPASAPETPR